MSMTTPAPNKKRGKGKAPNDRGFIRGNLRRLWNMQRMYGYGPICLMNQWVHRHHKLPKIPIRSDHVAVVTGGNRGIGAEVVKQLLQADMRVFMGIRNIAEGKKLIGQIRESGVSTGKAECHLMDLKSFESVRKFASIVIQSTKYVNVLINNAAVMFMPYELTEDGFDGQHQVNYLSHFLLTDLLLPWLIKGGKESKHKSRIVNVSSPSSYQGRLDFDNLFMEKFHCKMEAYGNTKLMQITSNNYLDNICLSEGWPLRSYSVHPGIVATNLFQYWISPQFAWFCTHCLGGNPPRKGADDEVFPALGPESHPALEKTGLLIHHCKGADPHPAALNKNIQKRLWETTYEVIGLDADIVSRIKTVFPGIGRKDIGDEAKRGDGDDQHEMNLQELNDKIFTEVDI